MIAALFARAVSRWRSRQFEETFNLPPRNHLACGAFHCRVCLKGFSQVRNSRACFAQNLSGALTDCAYSVRYALKLPRFAWVLNSADGLKIRLSRDTEVIVWSVTSFSSDLFLIGGLELKSW